MKISLVSDLHLDVSGYLDLPGGDVLILAGDICEVNSLYKEFHETKLIDRVPGYFPCYDFFHTVAPRYNKVFYVMGNHEHYRGRFDRTKERLKEIVPVNVSILENEVEEYNGVMFMGATLWTNLNNGDALTSYHIKHMLNDYRCVQNYYPESNLYHKLTPEHTFEVCCNTMKFFRNMWKEHKDKPFVVITHHAPSFASVSPTYIHDTIMNGGYASEFSEDILDHENIKVWIHGHMHDLSDYMIGDTRILCNPRGYLPYEAGNGFDPTFSIEI